MTKYKSWYSSLSLSWLSFPGTTSLRWRSSLLSFVILPLYTGGVSFSFGACMGDTSQRHCHLEGRVSPPGGGHMPTHLDTLHASWLPSELGRQDVLSDFSRPTSPPADRQSAGNSCQVWLQVRLLVPGRAPGRSSSRFFRVAPGSTGVFGVGPHFHQS